MTVHRASFDERSFQCLWYTMIIFIVLGLFQTHVIFMSLIRIESFVNNNGGSTCTRCKYYVQIFTHSVLIKLVLPQAAQLGIHFFKCSHHKLRSKYTHRESVCMQARGCLHAIFSFTSAFTKLDHLSKQNIVCLYQCTQLSQLM